MKKSIVVFALLSLVVGCGGIFKPPPETLPQFSPLDADKNCLQIQTEMEKIKTELDKKREAVTQKRNANIALGVVGSIIFLPALFLMDYSDQELIEVMDWQRRYQVLTYFYSDKQCLPPLQPTQPEVETNSAPDPEPQITEINNSLCPNCKYHNRPNVPRCISCGFALY